MIKSQNQTDYILKKQSTPNYSRPVLFENENEEYQYSFAGSSLGIKYLNKYFIVTAKHVEEQFLDSEISICYQYNTWGIHNFLPLKEELSIKNYKKFDDFYQYDIIIYEIDMTQIEDDFDKNTFYELSHRRVYPLNFSLATIIGFPKSLNNLVDYDLKKLKFQRFLLDVEILQNSKYHNMYKIQQTSNVPLNGMSGSPIYGVNINKSKKYTLIGMLVQEKYFMCINHIRRIIYKGFFTSY